MGMRVFTCFLVAASVVERS